MATNEDCKNCGKPVLVQIQKNTHFCSALCEDAYALKKTRSAAKRAAAQDLPEKKAVRSVVE